MNNIKNNLIICKYIFCKDEKCRFYNMLTLMGTKSPVKNNYTDFLLWDIIKRIAKTTKCPDKCICTQCRGQLKNLLCK